MALDVIIQRLLTGILQLHRAFCQPGRQHRIGLNGHVLLAAEAAAHQRSPRVHLFGGQVQHFGALALHIVDRLAGGIDQDAVLPLGKGHGTLRLQKAVLLPAGPVLARHHISGGTDGCIRVSAPKGGAAHHIAVGVDERRIKLQGVLRGRDGRERGIVHLDKGGNLIQCIRVFGGYHGKDIADIFRNVALAHHHIPVLFQVADDIAGHVLFRQDTEAGRMRLRFGDIEPVDPGAGTAGKDQPGMEHPVKIQVVGIDAGAVDLFGGIDAFGPPVKLQGMPLPRDSLLLTEEFRGHQDGLFDFLIARAAAEIAADGLFHVLGCRIRVQIQKAFRRDDHAGDAETALNGAGPGKAVLIDAHFLRRDPLHGHHLFPGQFAERQGTGLHFLPVDQDRAGAADPLAAAVLCRSQMQVIPQKTEQRFVLLGGIVFPIDADSKHGALPFRCFT